MKRQKLKKVLLQATNYYDHHDNDSLTRIMRLNLTAVFLFISIFVFPLGTYATAPDTSAYEYHQDFEAADPFQYWTSNGTYKINCKEISNTRASSGANSFKIDVTFGTATFLYWKIPITVANIGRLEFSGDLYVESSSGPSVALGTNVSLFPSHTSGVHILEKVSSRTTNWTTQSFNLISDGVKTAKYVARTHFADITEDEVGSFTDKIGLFIFAPKGGRIIIYVDNIILRGSVAEESAYKTQCKAAWHIYLNRVKTDANKMADFILDYSGGASGPKVDELISSAKSQTHNIKEAMQRAGYIAPQAYDLLRYFYQSMRDLSHYVNYKRSHTDHALYTIPVQPIIAKKIVPQILPTTIPGFALVGSSISIQGCRGEYEPASFVIRAEHSVSNIKMIASDLIGEGKQKIPHNAVDLKLVKCWYRSGDGTVFNTGQRILLPELLLNDDTLVMVDYAQQRNYLKVVSGGEIKYIGISLQNENIPDEAFFRDADVLQPFNLDAETNKQIWITVHIPDGAKPGEYKGTIRIQATEIPPLDMKLSVSILPFTLAPPALEYAIYYRGKLSATPTKGINSEWKTKEQYIAELKNIKEHGILYPTIYQRTDQMLRDELSLRNKVGLPNDHLYTIGLTTRNPATASDLEKLGDDVTRWMRLISEYGFGTLYVYGIDEASGDKLRSQKAAWQKIKNSGAKVFASGHNLYETVGDLLDVANLSGTYDTSEVAKFHHSEKKVFSYGNPQAGIEDPEIYRKNYGLGLFCAGYDGAMDYAYQHSFGHIWNDFDHERFRDHVFAYPTSAGVIDTIQWEGFREAVDDVRYLATLISYKHGQREQILSCLCPMLNNRTSMHEVRREIVSKLSPKTDAAP